ncbi:MAG: hypothetical protein IKN72_08530 [Clostridia bacterium]|nr:hypothetical protein [Clostridia bacterium]
MNPYFQPWGPVTNDPKAVEELLKSNVPHGRLVGCAHSSYQCPNAAMQTWNSDSKHWIGVALGTDGEVLTEVSKPQGSSRITKTYRPARPILPQLEAFVEKENLAALSELRCTLMPTGGTLARSILLTFADPEEERIIDCYALAQYGLDTLEAPFLKMLNDAVKEATLLSTEETRIVTPQAEALQQQPKVPHGKLLGCRRVQNPYFGAKNMDTASQTITAAQSDKGAIITVEESGPFRHTIATVYRPATDVLAAIEDLIDRENLTALSALEAGRGFMGLGSIASMGIVGPSGVLKPQVNTIDLTFDAPASDGAPYTTVCIDVNALAQNGLGEIATALEGLLAKAIDSANVVSSQKEVNERVRRVEELRAKASPHGTLQSVVYDCQNPGSGPQTASFYRYELTRTDAGVTLTAVEKAQYRNRFTTVYEPASDSLSEIEAYCEEENLAAFSALECSTPPFLRTVTKITLTYDGQAPIEIDTGALEEYGVGRLSSTLHQMFTDLTSRSPHRPKQWNCQVCGKTGNTGTLCPVCGFRDDLVITPKKPPLPAANAPEIPDGPDTWTCACGERNRGKFCVNCGTAKPQPAT